MRQGGSYAIDGDGKPRLVEEPTKEHPEGPMARDAEGKRLDRTEIVDVLAPQPTPPTADEVAPVADVAEPPAPESRFKRARTADRKE